MTQLENPRSRAAAGPWKVHRGGAGDRAVMFLDVATLDRNGLPDVVVAVREHGLIFHRRQPGTPRAWESGAYLCHGGRGFADRSAGSC